MANGASKPAEDDFGGATNVMESGLLRVLKQTSKTSDTGGWRAIADEMKGDAPAPPTPTVQAPAPEVIAPPKLEVVAAPPPEVAAQSKPDVAPVVLADPDPDVLIELEPEPDEPAPELSPLVVETSEPPLPANDRSRTSVVSVPPRRRSRVMTVAGIVAAVVLLADAAMFALHRRNVAQRATTPAKVASPATAAPPSKLPGYMVLPEHTVWPQNAPQEPAGAAPAPAAIAAPAATVADAAPATRSRHHRHHHSHH